MAMSMVDTLEKEIAGEPDITVQTVNLRVGALTGLVPEALAFSWELAVENSRLHGSALHIEVVDAAGFCSQCEVERTIANLQSFRCPACGTPITQVTGGKELEILTIEVVDHVDE